MEFQKIFNSLKPILEKYEPYMNVVHNTDSHYYLDTSFIQKHNKKPVFFAAVQIKKNYVSFYLMPVYVKPELLQDISPELKKRMQGKSCFHFKKEDIALFEELANLTEKGFTAFQETGFIQA
ncbi:DUF1801 domain-containing protein [Radiobacillus kanasensis]|uniref:DUF1801 domain-containing protein n=1 Tax=Radiobacillus kanasensis TaxID=2844358 RepID=UPI001E4018E7|nr:DUF1801 domain-containing protein [Radiobacillus kanasensis]UFT98299.1 DUF1801 domain-containing protein [Radiobacillus kanasensis]